MKTGNFIGSLVPGGSDHPGLVLGGALFYVVLVAGMICTIVNLAHGEDSQASARLSSATDLRLIALTEAEAYAWTPVTTAATCNAENWLDTGLDPVKQRAEKKTRVARNALANLVWAPPGTAIAYDPQAPVSQDNNFALRATTNIAAVGMPTLAAR